MYAFKTAAGLSVQVASLIIRINDPAGVAGSPKANVKMCCIEPHYSLELVALADIKEGEDIWMEYGDIFWHPESSKIVASGEK
jgi:hypothetical protein